MAFIFSLFSASPSVIVPQTWFGRLIAGVGWLLLAAIVLILLWRARHFNKPLNRNYWIIWLLLALVSPLASLFVGIKPLAWETLPLPNVPMDFSGPVITLFSFLPWMLAGGLLGPAGAASVAAIGSIFSALWNTHNLFTPLEYALLATLFSLAVMQRYRTIFYRWLRHPVFAALFLSLIYPFLFLLNATIGSDFSLAVRLDYAISTLVAATVAVAGQLLVSGIFCEVISLGVQEEWGGKGVLQPSPAERSLKVRYLLVIAPLTMLLLLTLLIGDWIMAGQAAQRVLRGRMQDTALTASKGIPYFLDVGQNEISKLVMDERLRSNPPAEVVQILNDYILQVPYFSQLYVLDSSSNTVAGYPNSDYKNSDAPPDEGMGIRFILQGVPYQTYTVAPDGEENAAQVSVVAKIPGENGEIWGVLIARTDLEKNPFTAPIIASLQNMSELDGEGILLDENGRIVYHPNPAMVMSQYTGHVPESSGFFDELAPDGTRKWVFYQPTEGRKWAVVLTVPAKSVQQIALDIATPLLITILIVALVTVILLSLSLNRITGSLQGLADQAGSIAKGQLEEPLIVTGVDEVGQLRQSFEQMRLSLKARLDELNQLLVVTQGVAANLDMGQAVQPILESALVSGAGSARTVLDPAMVPELAGEAKKMAVFSTGVNGDRYGYLDEQILNLTRQQERLVLNNVLRPRLLRFQAEDQRPEAVLAISLRHESQYYGALWIAYDRVHTFSEEEIRFMVMLAGQAAVAAAKARSFLNAEIGRQRLSAILASTPDPVLVTDQNNRLLLANPAAWRALGFGVEWDEGKPIKEVISQKDLLLLLDGSTEDKRSAEITLADNRVYYATASSVFAEGHRVGRVCVLRDVTSFKELDSLKSEFVATVSHDLRSPLTLVRGYASMLEIVGELNEQQTTFVRNIINGVENMSRLVNDLLDLGRIEAGIGLKLEMVPVRDVIERVTSALQIQATQRRIQLTTDVPAQTVPLIEADPALLQQALHNLVENAIKYTDSGGKVHVKAEVQQNQMVFIISDTGSGISRLDLPRIFEKFYRGAQANAKRSRGTGLGLTIVKSIADRHGGRVTVDSLLGRGSTFYFAIPIRQTDISE